MILKVGSLFSGIGGLDLGLERAGMDVVWQVENDEQCRRVLWKRWPDIPKYGDVREFARLQTSPVMVVCGGDPCPRHSRARSNGAAVQPDLSGYFLAVVGRYEPRWVVRENVPAPTIGDFSAALEALGYGTCVIRLDAAEVTGQSRQRDFLVGLHRATRHRVREVFSDAENGPGSYKTRLGTRQVTPCLTTHRTRYDSRDCYIWEPAWGLRILDGGERESLAGLPNDWTLGFSEATRARMCGNVVVPQVAEWIGRRIVESVSAF